MSSFGIASSKLHWLFENILRIYNLDSESFLILACLSIFLRCIILAHQAALDIQGSTSIKVTNNNRKPYWLNESKCL